jgi:Putative transposase.
MDRGIPEAIRRFFPSYGQMYRPAPHVSQVLWRIRDCRTEAMGGREVACPECGHVHTEWNSCRDRHCPVCQGARRELWLEDRREELLPTHYLHVVFTLPEELNPWVLASQREGYAALFHAAWDTLAAFAQKQGIQLGMTALLHTWGSALCFHPHLHCIVPAGGRDVKTGRWKSLPWVRDGKGTEAFLFPVRALSAMFKAKYMAAFTSRVKMTEDARQECFARKWVVYAKEPVCGVEHTLEYIARYAYRVALSNRRIQEVTDDAVTFEWKDYRDGGTKKLMTLDGVEFLRRLAMHVLPRGFFRIRHYGFLAPKNRDRLAQMQQQLGTQPVDRSAGRRTWALLAEARGIDIGLCPECGTAHVLTVAYMPRVRSPDAGCTAVY